MIRRGWLVAGLAALVAAWLWPLPTVGLPPFTSHMTSHMVVVAVACPFLALAVAGSRLDPVRAWPGAMAAIPLSLVELVGVWAWHTPGLHHAARHHGLAFAAEQGTFLAAGLLLWVSTLGGTPSQRRERATAGVTALLLTSMHMTLLGALLVLTPQALFGHGGGLGLTAAQDQHLGGAVMLLVGGAAYLLGALALTADVLRDRVVAEGG